jgi:phage-related protein
MEFPPREIPLFFYRTSTGAEPVREWLRELGTEDRSGNRIARVLFFVEDGRIGVMHGFVKKTQKTPADAIALADKRMKEMKK